GLQREDPSLPGEPPLEQFRARMVRLFTNGILFFFLLGALRNLALIPARWPVILGCVSVLSLFRLGLGMRWFAPRALPWAFAASLFLSFLPSFYYWGRGSLTPPLFVIPVFVIAVSLTGPILLGLAALALYLAVVGWYWLSPAAWTQGQFYVLAYLALLAPDLLAAGWIFWRLRLRRLESLAAQVEGHRRSLRMRRRLMGTLLHDMRNPLVVLASLAADKGPMDAEAARDMTDRMADILQAGRALLDVEGLVPRHRLRPVAWGDLLADTESLFASRMRDKELRLEKSGDPALRALALPDLLVNSVLANLLSNALKFSPRGSAITLEASERDGRLAIRVLDRGPGLTPPQLESFRKGQRLANSPGTEGEPGTGLGLFLSRDYARFMGGDLQLLARDGGGTEALLTLESAEA
ncbi:MAG TPA: HAMP domain-containing sensor histidine kinase, partial [bacterium]|nr:HAMP domain-containing sensor histidine kinase [bacterium]